MKISAFTMVRNADKYYFPIKESIMSALPIVDEFIVALGNNDADDRTRELIESIDSDKVKIIDRVWSEQAFVDGKIFADETSFALSECSGDWCIYLQADEVLHENDLNIIQKACKQYLHDKKIDGFLFNYHHFWGDYNHYLPFHGWYKNEIRIVRNNIGVYSYKDAQSFRKGGNEKLNVAAIDAYIYHYGWVRPPSIMQSKKKEQDSMHHGKNAISKDYQSKSPEFDYGSLKKTVTFPGSHPEVMKEFRSKINWTNQLNYEKETKLSRKKMKHEQFKYRVLSFLEKYLNNGKDFFGYSNWNKIK